ncbi:MAG: hypothetical protein L0027_16300, partial [Candidatus Rokubacteria bacterium]|nr:hypothetical protein [Candidatus Rokubacteria bacterium]
VNLDPRALPAELRPTASAISADGKACSGRIAVAAAVLLRLTVWYDALEKREASVVAAWRERSVAWWCHPVEVSAGERVLRGLARGVDERGALLLELEDGATVSVLAGEARALRLVAGPERQE